MIAALRGKVFEKVDGKILLDVKGVIYELFVSIFTYEAVKDDTILFVKEIIREDEYSLYGFINKHEKEIFERLLKINGVGPKVALAVCSTFSVDEFIHIVKSGDINSLKKVPGIGPKSAKRILLEIGDIEINVDSKSVEAIKALESLGFKKEQIIKVIDNNLDDVAMIIKDALKKLSKGV